MFQAIFTAIGSVWPIALGVLGLAIYGGYVLTKLIVDRVKK